MRAEEQADILIRLFPIADYAAKQDKDFKALFVGTKSGLETKLVPKAGYDIEYIEIQGLTESIFSEILKR